MIPKQVVLIGGGNSINEGLSLGLKDRLENKFTIGINYSYKHFDSTILSFIDKEFYKSTKLEANPDIYEELGKLPLIVGLNSQNIKDIAHPNTILLKSSGAYQGKESKDKGFYSPILGGVFSITLAMYLMDFVGTIFLLGFDWNKRTEEDRKNNRTVDTHYYKELKHRGIGYSRFYENHQPKEYLGCFLKEKKVTIYNVSLLSNLDVFGKLSYETFFEVLNEEQYCPDTLRESIRFKLK